MSEINITIEGGTSKRLLTAGKYCDRDIVVTAEGGGGGMDSSINAYLAGTLEEIDFDGVTKIHPYFCYENHGIKWVRLANLKTLDNYFCRDCNSLESVDLPNAEGSSGTYFCYGCENLKSVNVPLITVFDNYAFQSSNGLEWPDLPSATKLGAYFARYATGLSTLILRYTGGVVTNAQSSVLNSTAIAKGAGYIYVPKTLDDGSDGIAA